MHATFAHTRGAAAVLVVALLCACTKSYRDPSQEPEIRKALDIVESRDDARQYAGHAFFAEASKEINAADHGRSVFCPGEVHVWITDVPKELPSWEVEPATGRVEFNSGDLEATPDPSERAAAEKELAEERAASNDPVAMQRLDEREVGELEEEERVGLCLNGETPADGFSEEPNAPPYRDDRETVASPRPAKLLAETGACLPKSADVKHPKTIHFTNAQLRKYDASYRSPLVRTLRSAFDNYFRTGVDRSRSHVLTAFDPNVFADRFLLLSAVRGMFGGDWLTIRFREHRDAVYSAWILHGELDGFTKTACTPMELHWLDITFAEGENDPTDG